MNCHVIDKNNPVLPSYCCRLAIAITAVMTMLASVATAAECCDQPNEVLIIRGFGGAWPRMKEFRRKLKNDGFESKAIWAIQTEATLKRIIRDQRSGRKCPPVAIVGFSLGATNAQSMATDLGNAGIDVPLLVLVDGPLRPSVSCNVTQCLHYHRPNTFEQILPRAVAGHRLLYVNRRIIFARRGYKLRSQGDCVTVRNIQISRKSPFDSHLSIPGDETLQTSIVADITGFSDIKRR